MPKFTIKHIDGRYYVLTNWSVKAPDMPKARDHLQVTTGGRLAVFSCGWAKRSSAEAAIEACRRRLR